ncbi:MAG TPA: hypothetical protein VFY73_25460 [Ideonella sp.]|uniref:hypothetical protein n=1 Tax=Ideonella sp. TaxID=1929293 RepID=UPI002E353EE1|nr:hypothetical protein [Ideonella sp.]HEX5687378.1 hypothetical protein [Ideonella sp.]
MADLTIAAALPHAQGALKVRIRPSRLDFWEFEGTRAQIEAENVIPPGTEWPEGTQYKQFEVGRFRYWIRRTRPGDIKGPMTVWTSGDWWRLRCELISSRERAALRILDKERELAEVLYRQTPAGQSEWFAQCNRSLKADRDQAFQAFKATFIPQRKKPGRKPKSEATTHNPATS